MLDKRIRKWQFNLTAMLTIVCLTISKSLKTFVDLISIIVETFFLSTKRISTTTAVTCGEHLLKEIANIRIKGHSTNENMAS